MRHDVGAKGWSFELRPVVEADASWILELRSDVELSRYSHPTSPALADQERWLADYFLRGGDYYFAVVALGTGEVQGTIGLYNVTPDVRTGEWGRWFLRRGSPAAIESALMIYRVAFETLELERVGCRTLADNRQVVSFHNSCGLATTSVDETMMLRGQTCNVIEHTLTMQEWPSVRDRLESLARRLARTPS